MLGIYILLITFGGRGCALQADAQPECIFRPRVLRQCMPHMCCLFEEQFCTSSLKQHLQGLPARTTSAIVCQSCMALTAAAAAAPVLLEFAKPSASLATPVPQRRWLLGCQMQ